MKNQMTKPQLIQEIEQACQKANPLLADFRTLGIRFKFNEKILDFEKKFPPHEIEKIWILIATENLRSDSLIQTSEIRTQKYIFSPENYRSDIRGIKFTEAQDGLKECLEILGKEPQLADILILLDKEIGIWAYQDHIPLIEELLRDHKWDLTKGLYGQKDETIQFLHSLLFAK